MITVPVFVYLFLHVFPKGRNVEFKLRDKKLEEIKLNWNKKRTVEKNRNNKGKLLG